MKVDNIIPYFGGKTFHIPWLKSLFDNTKTHFIDGMCGSATVALNVNHKFVTINDINSEVYNFFLVLRNHFQEFKKLILFTPFSREEFENASIRTGDIVEDARRFYIRAIQGYGGNTSQNNHKGWTVNKNPHSSDNYFKPFSYNRKINSLDLIVEKLRQFQIENRPVLEILLEFDNSNNFIYLDPPYPLSTRSDKKRYRHDMTDADHIALLNAATMAKNASIAISSYSNELYDEILLPAGWKKNYSKSCKISVGKKLVQEILYTSYQPNTIINLFSTT